MPIRAMTNTSTRANKTKTAQASPKPLGCSADTETAWTSPMLASEDRMRSGFTFEYMGMILLLLALRIQVSWRNLDSLMNNLFEYQVSNISFILRVHILDKLPICFTSFKLFKNDLWLGKSALAKA